jgi:hypothetical protein
MVKQNSKAEPACCRRGETAAHFVHVGVALELGRCERAAGLELQELSSWRRSCAAAAAEDASARIFVM